MVNKKTLAMFIPLVVGLFLGWGAFNERIAIGHFLFDAFRLVKPAIFLANEAELALKAGNYYFNVYGDGVYDLEKARDYFNLALDLDPNVPDAWHQLARIDFLEGDFYNALKKINKQLEIHRDSLMPAYYVRGLIHGYARQFKKAEKDFIIFLKYDPKNWATHNDLAWIYFQMGDYENTETIARKGLRWAPDNPWLLNILGVSLLNLNSKEEAHMILKKALENAKTLTETDWHKAYPGNNPTVAVAGIRAMIKTIEFNIALVVDN